MSAQLGHGRASLSMVDHLSDLSPDDVAVVGERGEVRRIPKGQLIYSRWDSDDTLFFLVRGRVRLYRLTSSGKRLELATIEPGAFFGDESLNARGVREAYAEAAEDVEVYAMSRADFEQIICERPHVALRSLEALSRRIALAEARLEDLAYRCVPSRTAAVLVRLSGSHDDNVIPTTHQELGDLVGALRETVSRTLDDFQAQGLVQLGRGHIVIRDVAGLRARTDDERRSRQRQPT